VAVADVVIAIKSLYDGLSATQKQLADFIVKYRDEVPFWSIHEWARRAKVSVASISRFARMVGYKDIKDLKVRLGKGTQSPFNLMYQAIQPQDGDEQVVEKVFSGNIRSLEDTLKILDREKLVRAARVMAGTKRIVFYGIGSSGYLAQDAALRFGQIGIAAEAYIDSYQMLSRAFRMKKGEMAVGISHSGRSAITVKVLELAKANGTITMGISNYGKSPLRNHCTMFLATSFPESRVKVAALSSRVAQMCLMDALYLLVARYTKIDLACTERLNTYAEELLRIPPR
jgi:RpiR family transcriptional regulator, carbohydrate utilization regulator